MDDTNPTKEESEYVESIKADVNWLIRDWADHVLGLKANGQTCAEGALEAEPFYASDYFDQMFEYALELIAKSIPTNNAVVHGLVDGAQAASDRVDQLKGRQLASPLTEPSPSLPS